MWYNNHFCFVVIRFLITQWGFRLKEQFLNGALSHTKSCEEITHVSCSPSLCRNFSCTCFPDTLAFGPTLQHSDSFTLDSRRSPSHNIIISLICLSRSVTDLKCPLCADWRRRLKRISSWPLNRIIDNDFVWDPCLRIFVSVDLCFRLLVDYALWRRLQNRLQIEMDLFKGLVVLKSFD